jgi:ATP-binding cassette subfamily B protein
MLVDGRIAATGTHRELLAHNAEYRRLLSTMDEIDIDEDEDEEVAAR